MRILTKGEGRLTVGVVGRLHGNEPLGEEAIELLLKKNIDSEIVYLIANEEAGKKNVRFLESDLNRSFPGNANGNHEERLAARIVDELKECDFVIDIHATTARTEPFIILTKDSELNWSLAKHMPLSKVVLMRGALAREAALIDYVRCGISIEFPKTTKPAQVSELVEHCIKSLQSGMPTHDKKEIFAVYDALTPRAGLHLENFAETTIDGETFVPVLFGEVEYNTIACLKAKRIR